MVGLGGTSRRQCVAEMAVSRVIIPCIPPRPHPRGLNTDGSMGLSANTAAALDLPTISQNCRSCCICVTVCHTPQETADSIKGKDHLGALSSCQCALRLFFQQI